MNLDVVMDLLFWSFVINSVIFVFWIGMFMFAREWIYELHSRWFDISMESFCSAHYLLMGAYKLYIICFNLIPYLILTFII